MSSYSLQSLDFQSKFQKGKRIKVFVNSDVNCYKFTINQKQFRTWNSVLLHVTDVIHPAFGAIRKLISLRNNQEVWSYDDLKNNEKYIGFGGTSYTKLIPKQYKTSEELESSRRRDIKKIYAGPKRYGDMRFISQLQKKNLTVIYAVLNGVNNRPPQKVVFDRHDINNWQLIKNYLTRILSVPEYVGDICTINGVVIRNANEFQPGYLYVVIPNNQPFIRMDYSKIFLHDQSTQERMKVLNGLRKKTVSRIAQDFVRIQNVD